MSYDGFERFNWTGKLHASLPADTYGATGMMRMNFNNHWSPNNKICTGTESVDLSIDSTVYSTLILKV